MIQIEEVKTFLSESFSTEERKNLTCDIGTCFGVFVIIVCLVARHMPVEEKKNEQEHIG